MKAAVLVALAYALAGCDDAYQTAALELRTLSVLCEPETLNTERRQDGNTVTLVITCKKRAAKP